MQNIDAECSYIFTKMEKDENKNVSFFFKIYKNETILQKCTQEYKMELYWLINAFMSEYNNFDKKFVDSFVFYILWNMFR